MSKEKLERLKLFEILFFIFLDYQFFMFAKDVPYLSESPLLLLSQWFIFLILPLGFVATLRSWRWLKCTLLLLVWAALVIRIHIVPITFNYSYPIINMLIVAIIFRSYWGAANQLSRILNLTLSLAYLYSSYSKMHDPLWASGEALETIFLSGRMTYAYFHQWAQWIEAHELFKWLTFAIIFMQMAFLFSNFSKKLFLALHLWLIAFHLLTALVMDVLPVSITYFFLHLYILLTSADLLTNSVLDNIQLRLLRKPPANQTV